jgi:hypothetical protein
MAFAPTVPGTGEANPLPLAKLQRFAVANLPTAAQYEGCVVVCTNGATGSPCLAVSDGIGWFQVAVGNAVAAS